MESTSSMNTIQGAVLYSRNQHGGLGKQHAEFYLQRLLLDLQRIEQVYNFISL